MKSLFAAAAAFALLALYACATPEVMQATGGSRADGTVDLSYEYGMLQKPVVDMAAAEIAATDRCKAWGYTGAEPFGGQLSRCEASDQYPCTLTLVTVKYQCTGGGLH
jgi:hypothetical protein